MDDARFDAMTRALGVGTTRRGVTRLLTGLTLGGLTLGGLLSPISSHAKKHGKGKGKNKARGKSRSKGDGQKSQLGAARKARRTCRAPGGSCSRSAQCCSSKCAGGTCRCKTASQCPDPGPCRTRVCTAAGACTPQPAPVDTPCGDGDACTEGSRCDGQGQCVAGTPKTCDDDVACTDDRCDPATGCVHTPNDARCPGGQVCDRQRGCVCDGTRCGDACECTGGQICQGGTCGCDPTVSCGDDCPCPGNQVCQGGQCGCPAGTRDCDGDDACEQLGTDQHCAACNDTCTGGQVCRGGTCVTPAVCGNGRCDPGETCSSCPDDCGACPGPVCVTDGDCVPATCCHPSWCVPVAQGPRFCGGACSGECKALTMDCGQGHCACLSGECVAVSDPWCGDLECNGGEDCLSCPEDCGPCPEPECATWTDCTGDDCCHPVGCLPLAQAPVCDGIACDAGCWDVSIDCGKGYCDCRGGMCVAVFNGIN